MIGFIKLIGIFIAAIAIYGFATGFGGFLTYNDKKAINTDITAIKDTLEKVLDSQKEFQKQRGMYSTSIAGPFIKGLDASGTGYVAELDRFADKIFNKDGSQFDPYTTAALDKETYVLEKGVKIYTAPIYEIITEGNGNQEVKSSFKIFVDASGYSANAGSVLMIESEICLKLKELAGEFRTACNGTTAEKITSYSNSSNELTLTEKNAQLPDGDGFVSATIVEKYKI